MNPNATVRSGEIELALYDSDPAGTAPKQRPMVLLVHGYPDAASVWQPVMECLARQYRVVAYDVRGAGRSTTPGRVRDYGIDCLIDDLAEVLHAVSRDQPVHLVCHDWGSIACWEAVTTARLNGRIASYTSISGPSLDHAGYWLRRSGWKLAAKQMLRSWYMWMFQLPLLAPLLWRKFLGRRWHWMLKRMEGTSTTPSPTQAKDGANGVNLYRANVLRRLLNPRERRTDLPVQLIVPTRDRFVEKAMYGELPRWAPRLWRRDIDAAHWVLLSHPQAVAQYVSEFVDFVETGSEPPVLLRARVAPLPVAAPALNQALNSHQ